MTTSQRADDQQEHLFSNLEAMAGHTPELLGCSDEIPLDEELGGVEAEAIAFDAELEVEWASPRLA